METSSAVAFLCYYINPTNNNNTTTAEKLDVCVDFVISWVVVVATAFTAPLPVPDATVPECKDNNSRDRDRDNINSCEQEEVEDYNDEKMCQQV